MQEKVKTIQVRQKNKTKSVKKKEEKSQHLQTKNES